MRESFPRSFCTGLSVALENVFVASQISKGPDVSNDQCDSELILGAALPEGQAPILERDSAAGAVVADLHQLILQKLLLEVIAEAKRGIPTATIQVPISYLRTNLICEGL